MKSDCYGGTEKRSRGLLAGLQGSGFRFLDDQSQYSKRLDGSRSKEMVCVDFIMVVSARSRWETWNRH